MPNDKVLQVKKIDEDADLDYFYVDLQSFFCLDESLTSQFHSDDFMLQHKSHEIRAYAVGKNSTIAAIFSLKCNAIEFTDEETKSVQSIPCVEIVHYAISKDLKGNKYGRDIFDIYIRKKIQIISNSIGIVNIILFSINEEKVIKAYESMGFKKIDNRLRKFVQSDYSKECIPMLRTLDNKE